MKMGKLPKELLVSLLQNAPQDSSVILGPAYGEDAAAVALSGEVMVAASDPITFATDQIGWYAVTVNVNDIAVCGAVPKYFIATVLLPRNADESLAADIFTQISQTCRQFGISLIGGHTEVTDAVTRAVVSGVMFGETNKNGLITTSGVQAGDDVLLAGKIAVEGTALLAIEAADQLLAHGVDSETIQRSAAMLKDPGICVLEYARLALESPGIHCMHDPTEGGLASALNEIASAGKCGIIIEKDNLPVLEECRTFCDALGLDPMGLIASGSLLITCSGSSSKLIIDRLNRNRIPCVKIGEATESSGVVFSDGSVFPVFERDEIARYFEEIG